MCVLHYERLKVWAESLIPRTTQEAIAEAAAVYRGHLELEHDRAVQRARDEAMRGIVYYVMRDTDSLIKIGTTRKFPDRIATLKGEHGSLKLMTAEYGGAERETKMHRRFRGLRVQGEWFRPALPLLLHIARLRRHQLQAGALKPDVSLEEVVAMIRALGGDWQPPARRGSQRRAA